MLGVVDVGGGLRGIYGAGVFDKCMDTDIRFDYCIGVSAGSANIASYAAGQRGRNYRFYRDYAFRKEYMGVSCLFGSGSLFDVNYIYGSLTNSDGEDPLDYERFCAYSGKIETVATDALTGEPVYFGKTKYLKDDYYALKASCSLPIVCKPCVIDGIPYFDGGISNPVPIEKAFSAGCDRVVLILTKPENTNPASFQSEATAALIKSKYPALYSSMRLMNKKYTDSVKSAQNYAKNGRLLIVAPNDCCGMKTLTRDKRKLDSMYQKGYYDAEKVMDFCLNKPRRF